MAVPTSLASLSTTPGSNPPSGAENPFPELDDHLRRSYAFHAENRDAIATKLNSSAVSAFGLTLIDDADAATARTTLGAVGTTGNQTIAGTKTFSSPPVVPDATASGHAANKGQLDSATQAASLTIRGTVLLASTSDAQVGTDASKAVTPQALGAVALGVNQTFSTPSRSAGATYTNGTGRPITVYVYGLMVGTSSDVTLRVNGFDTSRFSSGAWPVSSYVTLTALVPSGATYQVFVYTGSFSVTYWTELS